MTEPIPEETSDFRRRAVAAQQVAQNKAKELVADVKGRGPFFLAKLYVVAAWVLISLLTVVIAPPSKPDWTASQLQLSFGLSTKTEVRIMNHDGGDLDEAVVEVTGKGIEYDGKETPGTWRTKPLALLEGMETKIVTEQLFDAKGVNPPYTLDVKSLTIFEDEKGKDKVVTLPVPVVAK